MKTKPEPAAAKKRINRTIKHLLWECCERIHRGEPVDLAGYLRQLPDEESRHEFELQVAMAELVNTSIAFQTHVINRETRGHFSKLQGIYSGNSQVEFSFMQPYCGEQYE